MVSFRLEPVPIRTLSALGTLTVVAFYLIAQMVGAGKLIELLFGLPYLYALMIIVGALMIVYVAFGGMVATTWVQIIKACLLLGGATFMAFMVLVQLRLLARGAVRGGDRGASEGRCDHGARRRWSTDPISAVSLGLALMFGTAGLAAYPDALLHRGRRQGRTQIRVLRHRLHRLLLRPHLHHRLRGHHAS